jgi:hypothetical protein
LPIDPWLVEISENRRGIRGNDERLSIDNIAWGVQFYSNVLRPRTSYVATPARH